MSNLTRIKKGETTAIGGLTYKITVTDDENDIGEAAVIGVDYYLVTTVTIPAKISYKGRSFLVTTGKEKIADKGHKGTKFGIKSCK